jgi:hypothetical protein
LESTFELFVKGYREEVDVTGVELIYNQSR